MELTEKMQNTMLGEMSRSPIVQAMLNVFFDLKGEDIKKYKLTGEIRLELRDEFKNEE